MFLLASTHDPYVDGIAGSPIGLQDLRKQGCWFVCQACMFACVKCQCHSAVSHLCHSWMPPLVCVTFEPLFSPLCSQWSKQVKVSMIWMQKRQSSSLLLVWLQLQEVEMPGNSANRQSGKSQWHHAVRNKHECSVFVRGNVFVTVSHNDIQVCCLYAGFYVICLAC